MDRQPNMEGFQHASILEIIEEPVDLNRAEQVTMKTIGSIDELIRKFKLSGESEGIKIDGIELPAEFKERVCAALQNMASQMEEKFDPTIWAYHNLEHLEITQAVAMCIADSFLRLSSIFPGFKVLIN